MNFTLIVCTYMRPQPLLKLLRSVAMQTLYPNEILIIDGSLNNETEEILKKDGLKNISYYKVNKEHRGLTRQRNFGIERVSELSKVVCFLDDDIILKPNYFEILVKTYSEKPDALAVGGYIINEVNWEKSNEQNNSLNFLTVFLKKKKT